MLLRQHLEPISKVRGIKAVGVFTPNGEMLDVIDHGVVSGNVALAGNLLNELFLNAKEITRMLEFEAAETVEVDTEKVTLMARSYNDDKQGKHFHLIASIEKGGNVAMTRILLEQAANNMVKEF